MKRAIINCVRVMLACVGAVCVNRIFFLLGYASAPYGWRGFLTGALYLIVIFAAELCIFGLYADARLWLDKRRKK